MITINAETHVQIRAETPGDAPAILAVTQAAFAEAEHSSGTEGAIIEALRQAGALTVSLVADADGMVIGHIAFSPITVNGRDEGWFGLGPVSVDPGRQGNGVGSRLVSDGVAQLKTRGAKGCVVLGDPRFYKHFGSHWTALNVRFLPSHRSPVRNPSGARGDRMWQWPGYGGDVRTA